MMRAYLGQTAWLLLERVLRLGLGAAVSILMARALGPGGFGHLSAAQAILAVISPFAALGLDALTVRWLLAQPLDAGRLLSTLLCTKVVAALLAQSGLLLACGLLPRPEAGLVALLSSVLLFQVPLTLDQYFQSRVRGRLSALAQIAALLLCGGLKLAMVYWGSSVYWFAAAIAAEAAIIALLLFRSFLMLPDRPHLERPSPALSREKLRQSFPLILSTVVATLFVSTDQLMLRTLAGAAAVGIYAAAVRLTEAWYALLIVMASSVFPAIVQRALAGDKHAHDRQMQIFYEISLLLSVIVALPVSLFARQVIALLYGAQFAQSATVLVVHIWAGVFIGWRLLSGKWMLAEGLIRLSMYRSLWGLALNLSLAWVLIPRYGVAGSAWAALAANAMVGLVSDLFNPLTRGQGILKLRSLRLEETRSLTRAMLLRARAA